MIAGLNLPHCPFIAPAEVYRKYDGRVQAPHISREHLEGLHQHHRDYRECIQLDTIPKKNEDRATVAYYALTDILDQNVGELIETLKATGQWENTIVIYTSDHGEMLGYHGRWHKECFREDSARVPLIIRHPDGRKVKAVSNLHSLVDLMPTLCEWMGVQPPPGIDGESMLNSLEGQPAPDRLVKSETYTHWTEAQHGMSANRMVRKGPWKLCYYGAYDSFELFNLDDDPEEETNQANNPNYSEILNDLKTEIFSEGWSRDIVKEIQNRLNEDGGWDNIKAYRDALRESTTALPRPVEHVDIWDKAWTEPTTLD
jgi:choline-sulfatase